MTKLWKNKMKKPKRLDCSFRMQSSCMIPGTVPLKKHELLSDYIDGQPELLSNIRLDGGPY